MRTIINRSTLSVVLAAGLLSAGSAVAQDMDSSTSDNASRFYVNGDAGVAIMQNMSLKLSGFGIGEIQYDVGPKVDLSAGYNLNQNVAVELQSGFAYNAWSKLGGQSLSGSGTSANLWTVPVMANGIYKYNFNDHWQAYGGLGAGVVISMWDLSESGFGDFSSTDCTFGYQAMFGIKYRINDNLECGLGYNFLGSLDHHWSLEGEGLRSSPTYLHSVLLSLTYKF